MAGLKKLHFHIRVGCDIGARPIDLHLEGFEKLGVVIEKEAGYIRCKCEELIGANIHLDFPSVGATENIMMAAVLAKRRNSNIQCSNGTRSRGFSKFFK